MRRRTPAVLIAAALAVPVLPAGPAAAAPVTVRVSVDSAEQQLNTYHDNPAVSSSGRFVAFEQSIFSVYVRDNSTGTTELITANGSFPDPDLSADGNLVVYQIFNNLALYNRASDVQEALYPVTGCTCSRPAISGSGSIIAFDSSDSDLAAGDANGAVDVFVLDRSTGGTALVSVSSAEVQGNGISSAAAVSPDGRYVAFQSDATNLVAGDTNGKTDVFLRDRTAGTTVRISVDSAETQGNDFAVSPDVSANGRYVAFDAKSSNWPGSTGAVLTYVRDRVAGTTELVSVSSGEMVADNVFGYGDPAISDNGRYVSFSSNAGNLVAADTGNDGDVFLRDRTAGTTTQISVTSAGAQANGSSRTPAIAGKTAVPVVAFVSFATNLGPGDTNGQRDIFARRTA